MNKTIKLILADDHRIFRDGIKSLLSDNGNIEILGEVSCGEDLIQMLKVLTPHIIIMDISMPGMSGIETTKKMVDFYPNIKIIILSMHTNEEFVINSIKAGASGYLPKDSSKEELLEAIQIVFNGGEYYSKLVSDNFLRNYIRNIKIEQSLSENQELTAREIEILKLSSSGISNKDIAEKLFISIKTVDAHKNHIMQKLKLKNTAEMVIYAVKNNIIEI